MAVRLCLPAALLSLTALGCEPQTVPNPTGPDAGADKACADNAYARCSRLSACSPVGIQFRYGDEATCEALFKGFCLSNLASPSTGATPATAEACAQAIPSWDCNDFVFNQNVPPECGTQPGQQPMGGACAFPSQCQSAFCAIAPGAACGACAPQPKPGDSCANLTTCGLTLNCESATNTCAAFGVMGAPCGPSLPCGGGLGCSGANAMQNGTCQPTATTVGAPCTPGSAGCDFYSGLVCNALSGQCARMQLAKGGQSCGSVNYQNAVCEGQGDCLGETTTPGVCRASAALGEACDLVQGPHCVGPARCISSDGGTGGICAVHNAAACR